MMKSGWVGGFLVLAISASAWGKALYVGPANGPWNNEPIQTFADLGIPYDSIEASGFSTQELSGYCFVYLAGSGAGDQGYLNYVVPNMARLESYVSGGGLAIVHFADLQDSSSFLGDIAPFGLGRIWDPTNDVGIAAGKEGDPLFNGLTGADLDGWVMSAHGYLVDLPQQAEVLVEDYASRPVYVRYAVGAGEVWVTTMPDEWSMADPGFLDNELSLAKLRCGAQEPPPIPEPLTMFGILSSLGALGAYLRRRRA